MTLGTWKNKQDGVAIIELAILLVFLLLLTWGITEIGRAFWYYSAMQKATREGARYVSMQNWSGSDPVSTCKNLVKEDANAAGVSLGLTNVACAWDTGGGWGASETRPEYITVSIVNYRMPLLWFPLPVVDPQPMVIPGTPPSIALGIQTTMPYMK